MRIICSWCLREGKIGLIGEKTPLDDLRETHSICTTHYYEIEIRWKKGRDTVRGRKNPPSTALSQSRKRRVR
ncbi:MAG: hypothetical protein OEY28_04730 [Nitrospira sp.]|nr:hypothetical protein [Nitrospira sp.]